jgi:hypothetical protein
MSHEPRLVFIESRELGHPGSLETMIAAVHNAGFAVRNVIGGTSRNASLIKEYDPSLPVSFDVAYQNERMAFEATNENEGLSVLVRLHWCEGINGKPISGYLGAVSYQRALFTRSECDPNHYSRLFLDLGKALYRVLSPEFGWLDICEPAGFTKYEDVRSLDIPHFYWANFLGPAYVRRLGRSVILSAPSWSVEELGDGGLLYVLAPWPGYARADRVSLEAVEAHFGLRPPDRSR